MRRNRRDDLIHAATESFRSAGFRAVGVDRLLDESGVSRMTLYNHFGSKDELIVAVLNRYDENTRAQLRAHVEQTHPSTPRDRLAAAFNFYASAASDDAFRGCLFLNACAEFADADCRVRQAAANHKRLVREYLAHLAEQAAATDPWALAGRLALVIDGLLASAAVHARTTHRDTVPTVTPDAADRARETAELIINHALA